MSAPCPPLGGITTSNSAPVPTIRVFPPNVPDSNLTEAYVYPVPPTTPDILSTTPLLILIVTVPPVPSPVIGIPEIVPVDETVPLSSILYPDPPFFITTVSIFPSTAASFIFEVVVSPHSFGKGM